MLALYLALTLILLAVCCFTPGFFFVRWWPWSPMEKLCGSVGLSLILIYLAAWGIYLIGPADQKPALIAISLACGVLGALAWRDATRLFRRPRVRRATLGYGFLLIWTLLILAMIRVYSGAAWSIDWLEHFQRSLYFLQRFPTAMPLFSAYQLPARPPMMNVLAGFFLGQTQDRFEIFQLVFAFLNLLPFLACGLMMPRLLGPRKSRLLPLAALFAMSPVAMENATYTWTKSLTSFYVVLALWFYLAGWRKNDARRMTAAFLALSAGLLVHYSAGPYCVVVGMHYLAVVFRKRERRWRELALIAAVCGVLLLTWFGWSVAVYGARVTAASNTSVTSSQQYQGNNLGKIAGNLLDSIVPGMLTDPALARTFDQPNRGGQIRDVAFITYQTNLIFAMGAIGGPLVLWLLCLRLRRRAGSSAERNFWRILIPAIVLLGIAVVGERDRLGVAHLTLLPMEMLGLTLLAAAWSRRRFVAFAILAGCVVDFSLGVFLQARIENLENSPGRAIFSGLSFARGAPEIDTPGKDALTQNARGNWYLKHQFALCQEWLRGLSRYHPSDPQLQLQRDVVRQNLQARLEAMAQSWRGWFSRNGGSVTYLGDHFGEGEVFAALLLTLWMALMWRLCQETRRIAPEVPRAMRPASRGRRRRTAGKR